MPIAPLGAPSYPARMVRRALPLILLSLLAASCRSSEASTGEQSAPQPTPSASASELEVPVGYDGPIDPQWPPSAGVDLNVEIKAARMIRQAHKRGEQAPLEELLDGDEPNIFADEGRIGGLDYIEVVLGPMKHPEEEMPLVVLLHGRGGRPTIPRGPYLTKKPLRLFIPRGPDELGKGYNWLATWTNSGKIELLSRSLAGRVDQLMPAIEAFAELHKTKGKPVVVGFSQGGILSFALATRYPSKFEAAFPIAGWLPPGMLPTKKKEGVTYPYIHAIHGGADNTVPTEKGRQTVEALRKLGIKVDYTEIPDTGHVISPIMGKQVRKWVRESFDAD